MVIVASLLVQIYYLFTFFKMDDRWEEFKKSTGTNKCSSAFRDDMIWKGAPTAKQLETVGDA